MAYIARLRNLQKVGASSSAVVSSRGDKWYIDPEECRQYNSPFFTRFGGAFPPTYGPDKESPYQNSKSTYPRMPFYTRQLHNPHLKYDTGIDKRKNYGETIHVLEEWLHPQHRVWAQDNGTNNIWWGFWQLGLLIGMLYMTIMLYDAYDEKYCLKWMAPKIRPFENLWEEQGGYNKVPKELRPYYNDKIFLQTEQMGMQPWK